MTVADLIEKLHNMPPNAYIRIWWNFVELEPRQLEYVEGESDGYANTADITAVIIDSKGWDELADRPIRPNTKKKVQ